MPSHIGQCHGASRRQLKSLEGMVFTLKKVQSMVGIEQAFRTSQVLWLAARKLLLARVRGFKSGFTVHLLNGDPS